jgi:predicted DsbA family dithiol-disulfide isomerase
MDKKTKYMKISVKNAVLVSLALIAISALAGYSLHKLKLKIASKLPNQTTASKTGSSNNIFNPKKSDKPELKFFVMSFCPYGNQMETILRPVADLLGKQANITPRYIFEKIQGNLPDYCKKMTDQIKSNLPDPNKCADLVKQYPDQIKDVNDCKQKIAQMSTQIDAQAKQCNDEKQYLKLGNNFYSSLHGRQETNQDVREICAYNLSDDKTNWWKFVDNVNTNCTEFNADTCWEDQAKKANLDTTKITECFNKDAASLIDKEIAQTEKYQISGSPTLMVGEDIFPSESAYTQDGKGTMTINKKVISESQYRSPNTIKEAICAAFNKAPKECSTILPEIGAQAANSTAGCGK